MSFTNFLPDESWSQHIAFYWILKTEAGTDGEGMRIYADGCSDIICNAGTGTAYFQPLAGEYEAIPLKPGQLYLGGTMTAYGVLKTEPGCILTGIRFLPGGFYALFSKSMKPAVDATILFPHKELNNIMLDTVNLESRLNQWVVKQSVTGHNLNAGKYDFLYLRKRMYDTGGQISVESLSDEMCVSNRTLERIFKRNVGIPPKDFLRIVRFQEVLNRLQSSPGKPDVQDASRESLLQIAFELGYYDHAHLTNEFKKYSGVLPSSLAQFYKTGVSDGQYY